MSVLEKELIRMGSCDAVSEILAQQRLHGLQGLDVLKMLARKRAIALYDTGLGKTFLAAAIIKMLHYREPTFRFIMFVTKNQLIQTPKKLKDLTGLTLASTDGTFNSIKRLKEEFSGVSIVLATYSCLESRNFMDFFYEKRDKFGCLFVDEAHKLNNFVGAATAASMQAIVKKFEYAFALTATPITTDVEQLARLASMFDPESYGDAHRLATRISSGSFSLGEDPCFFVLRSAKEFGRETPPKGVIFWLDSTEEQDRVAEWKGDGAITQAKSLAQLIQFNQGKRGLVYIRRHKVREWVIPFLEKAGIRYACINGRTKQQERVAIVRAFNEEKSLDVVITSVTEAIDLDCDFVIFYEFTADIKQMIGRAQRGFRDKDLFVFYMITDGTPEVSYFYHNVFERCELAAHVLKKDYSEVLFLEDELLEHLQD